MSLFSRRHYEYMAKNLRGLSLDHREKSNTAWFLAVVFKDDNPNFNEERWYQAVGN